MVQFTTRKIADVQETLTGHFETDLTLAHLSRSFKADLETFERDGLGEWEGFVIKLKDAEHLFFSAQKGNKEFGASVRFEGTSTMTGDMVARIINNVAQTKAKFMSPQGVKITPKQPHP